MTQNDSNNGHGAPTNNDVKSLWPIAVALLLLGIAAVLSILFVTPNNGDNNSNDKGTHTVTTTTADNLITITNPSNIAPTQTIGPCATEDSENCYRFFGGPDGEGKSFVNIDGTVYYLHGN